MESVQVTRQNNECHSKAGKVDVDSILVSIINRSIQMEEYLKLLDKLDNGMPDEKNDAELELLGRYLYYEGD